MTEGGALDLFSGRRSPSDDKSCHNLGENGETGVLDHAETVTSTTLPATGSEPKVAGDTSPAEQSETCDLNTVSKRGLKRTREIEPMDHSGLERKVPCVLSRVGAIQCLSPLSLEELKLLSPAECGEELARCLDEPKVGLIKDVVQGLGIEKAFELFNDTAEIQSNGGQIAAEGNYKKAPGGVFLALVKKAVTKEERDVIFKFDRQKKSIKKRQRNRRLRKEQRTRENDLKKRKEDWEKEVSQVLQENPDARIPEWDDAKGEPVHVECNMQKRLPSNSATNSNTGTNHSLTGQTEPMELDVGCVVTGLGPAELKTATAVSGKGSVGGSTVPVQQEILAAEEFERTSDCNVVLDLQVD